MPGINWNGGLTISIQVKDIAKSKAWYQQALGFTFLYEIADIGWCELATAVQRVNVGLSQVEAPKVGGPVPTFGTTNIEHARAHLESLRVPFDGPTQVIPGLVKLATFFDPDGNALMLFEELKQS
jgi:catechol 2,3-dioxygenase-like lactoylglutathione lyase family enzyme